jgi:hypothetical protein
VTLGAFCLILPHIQSWDEVIIKASPCCPNSNTSLSSHSIASLEPSLLVVLRNCPGVDWRRQLDSKCLGGEVRGDLGLCDMVNSNGDLEGSGQVWNSIGIIV